MPEDTATIEARALFIQTFGCQMNVRDSEQMAELLRTQGYELVDDEREADLIILNTCSIRAKAEQKAASYLGRIGEMKRRKRSIVIGMAGCLAQQWGRRALDRLPYLDFVCGTHNIDMIPEMVQDARRHKTRRAETAFRETVASIGVAALPAKGSVTAFVTIMQGCDNYCTYCIVPYVRGREESRESGEILQEIRIMADKGVREVTLLGQNVNSYGMKLNRRLDFPGLLDRVSEIEGIERIRFISSHPKDLSDRLIDAFRVLPKLCDHIHLPVQAGSDRILKLMGRGYGTSEYIEKVAKLREARPGIAITTDFIVGFPGEADEDFQKTIDLMEKIRFDNSFSFKYSPRPGIAAEFMEQGVPEEVKRERLTAVQALQRLHSCHSNRLMVGRQVEVLVEGPSKRGEEDVMGRTGTNKIVNIAAPSIDAGSTVEVTIARAYLHSLRGEVRKKEKS
ncbi:MAG: tRNA (N6-isopentenyl adenosine(37)-C2)-methylthiotransferase MiaB [Deltaproteobacteria bacterium]|nr:tRNA (N6-isopentenyl adenosine(37)-C2)-methylthiotransferase MiaB [Deltaproteobacteria bacterium]